MQNIPEEESCTIQSVDGVSCRLKRPFDLSFMKRYGTVFKVFDDQDSGNLCFGTEKEGKRYFVKFAGAPTVRSVISGQEAVRNLQAALPVYRKLHHKNLIRYIRDETIGTGYAAIFEWVDGISMGRMYPRSKEQFMRLPLQVHLQIYHDLLNFLIYVHDSDYVAVDFYDGSILYDQVKKQVMVCDIDFFVKKPYINGMGRLWGSSRYMSPEEYQKGAAIDEITNVYTLGAMAFALFADYERTEAAWPLSKRTYQAVAKAVNPHRELRQQSIRELKAQWEAAVEG